MRRKYLSIGTAATGELTAAHQISQSVHVRPIQLIADIFSGKCCGFGFVGMEGHEARAAIATLDGNMSAPNSRKRSLKQSLLAEVKGGQLNLSN